MNDKLSVSISLTISIISLLISMCSTFYYTRKETQLSSQSRLVEMIDKIYELNLQRNSLRSETGNFGIQKLAGVQLQMKHLLFEIDASVNLSELSQSQNRLLAESFGELLYYDYAQKYWNKVFEKPFVISELKAEYYRRYAEFLYKKGDAKRGDEAFKESLSLPNTTDNKIYINFQTYMSWAGSEFNRERNEFYMKKAHGIAASYPTFEKAHEILNESRKLLELFSDHTLYWNAINNYNEVIESIEKFKKENPSLR